MLGFNDGLSKEDVVIVKIIGLTLLDLIRDFPCFILYNIFCYFTQLVKLFYS